MATTLFPSLLPEEDEDEEICGADLTTGGVCERLASKCQYH